LDFDILILIFCISEFENNDILSYNQIWQIIW